MVINKFLPARTIDVNTCTKLCTPGDDVTDGHVFIALNSYVNSPPQTTLIGRPVTNSNTVYGAILVTHSHYEAHRWHYVSRYTAGVPSPPQSI